MAVYRNIVVELEGLFLAPGKAHSELLDGMIPTRRIFKSLPWRRYEQGRASRAQTCEQLAADTGVPATAIRSAADSRLVWQMTDTAPGLLDLLKASGRKLYCMANLPREEWEVAREAYPAIWDCFEHVQVSSEVGVSRPSQLAIRTLLDHCELRHEETVFIDRALENLQLANALGIRSILYRDLDDLARRLRILDPAAAVEAGTAFVLNSLETETYDSVFLPVGTAPAAESEGRPLHDAYAVMLMFCENEWLAAHPAAVQLMREIGEDDEDGLYSFYYRKHELPPDIEPMPPDVDGTSLIYATLYKYRALGLRLPDIDKVAQKILDNRGEDGIVQVYFDPNRPRVDVTICASVLNLVNLVDRRAEACATEDYVYGVLCHHGYENGSLYYPSPDLFLYYVFRLVRDFPRVRDRFAAVLSDHVRLRIGLSTRPLDLAMRLIMCQWFGIDNDLDFNQLLELQQPDGSWDPGPVYLYPVRSAAFYSRTLETAFAVKALRTHIDGATSRAAHG